MRAIIFIALILQFLTAQGQEKDDTSPGIEELFTLAPALYSNKDELKSFDSVWKLERMQTRENSIGRESMRLERTLENGVYQLRFEFQIASTTYYFNLVQQEKLGRLVYFNLSRYRSLVFKKDNYVPTGNLSAFPDLFDFDFFGTFCGLHGGPPRMCNSMLDLVRDNNYEELSKWLHAPNPERAAYGFMGIQFLFFRDGFNIRKKERDRMKALEKSEIIVYSCKGCLFGFREKMKDVISYKEMKRAYEIFRTSGFLRE